MRVLKPGGHMAVFAGARTQDLMGLSIRLAGFEIRDTLGWIYGSGFPKSHNISKAIDKAASAEREVVGSSTNGIAGGTGEHAGEAGAYGFRKEFDITTPATDAAKQWDGWGTALKPAIEPIILARKPLDGTVANNVLAHGVGGLNIDACRVESGADYHDLNVTQGGDHFSIGSTAKSRGTTFKPATGRFPANVLLDEHAAKEMDKQSGVLKSGAKLPHHVMKNASGVYGTYGPTTGHNIPADSGGASRFFPVFKSEEEAPETKGRFPANVLLDEHAAAEMDKQSVGTRAEKPSKSGNRGVRNQGATWKPFHVENEDIPAYADSGGASRFFPVFKYQAKAPKKERPVIEREDGTKIQHPTVKPLTLLEWLVELITPPNGVVLDPFAGSGTTLQAAINKGFTPIGIEQDADYIKLIEKRLEATCTTHKN